VYLWMQRRKKWATTPGDYSFEMLEDQEETDGMLGGGRNSVVSGQRRGGRRRRAGELYDAFAGESEEDEGMFSGSEEGDGVYRDTESGSGDDEVEGEKG
jgi:kexin